MGLHVAAQEFGQPPADGQAQARSTEAARRRLIRLHKRLEKMGLLFGGHANASVDDVERNLAISVQRQAMDAQADFAGFGELQRVAQQVHENLLEAQRVRADVARNGADKTARKCRPFSIARGRISETTSPISCSRSVASDSTVILPASILEMSKMSLMSSSR